MSDTSQLYQLLIHYPLFFYGFASKHYPLSESHLSFMENELFWDLIALNEKIEFSIPLIEKYLGKLNKEDLGSNLKVSLNQEIMRYFQLKPRAYWKKFYGEEEEFQEDNSAEHFHPSIRYHDYSLEEIERKKENISWNHFSSNTLIQWNYNLIYRYKEYLWFGSQKDPNTLTTDGLELYNNEAVPWDVKLVGLFADKILTHKEVIKQFLFNESMVREIQPLFTEDIFTDALTKLRF